MRKRFLSLVLSPLAASSALAGVPVAGNARFTTNAPSTTNNDDRRKTAVDGESSMRVAFGCVSLLIALAAQSLPAQKCRAR